jgi:hypothetical protein
VRRQSSPSAGSAQPNLQTERCRVAEHRALAEDNRRLRQALRALITAADQARSSIELGSEGPPIADEDVAFWASDDGGANGAPAEDPPDKESALIALGDDIERHIAAWQWQPEALIAELERGVRRAKSKASREAPR